MSDLYRCPMPTVREDNDGPGETTHFLGVCGEPLYVEWISCDYLGDDPSGMPAVGDGTEAWELRCHGRHVLLTHDTEDRSAPLLPEHMKAVLDTLGAQGSDYEDRPDPDAGPQLWPRVAS